ncbi:MAG: hypothetical protein WC150_05225 [Bacteroidia bacterium]
MNIKTTLKKYKNLGDYFAPDYAQENDALNEFKKGNPNLSKDQTIELINLLDNNSDINDKYFVADLLYLYDNFDKELIEPLLNAAINHRDTSFNRVFLNPCLRTFGVGVIANHLADRFNKVDIDERIGILKLVYWLRPLEGCEVDKLHETIIKRANNTSNLIELYHYKLQYSNKIKNETEIPDSADDLIKVIKGNKEYEDLLFGKLGWK